MYQGEGDRVRFLTKKKKKIRKSERASFIPNSLPLARLIYSFRA